MNTLLNTISAQITYTRGALIALFAGLFILAACGGGGAATVADGGGTGVDCNTNIFDPACGVEKQAEQTAAIRACIDAIKTGAPETCDGNIPTAARNCLNEPFTDGCSDDVLPTSVTIASVQDAREADCRGGTEGSASCESTVVNFCGAVTSTKDGVLFTETLCGAEYDASRTTLINNCRTAGEASDEACTSVVITTDTEANKKALDCVLDAFGEGCDTNTDVMTVVEKTDATIKSIVETRQEIETDCLGRADFATNALCTSAIENTCDDNPFTLTTGASPTNFCTGANDGRAALIGRCSDENANNNEGCDATIGTGTTTVANCITDPFDTTNGCSTNTGFDATRIARTTLCTTDATLFDSLCDNFGAAGAITITRKAFIQTCLLTPRTACDVPTSSRTHTVTQCITNPHSEACKDDLDFAEVKSARTTLCTDTALYFDPLCNTYENIVTTRQTRCTVGATSFDDICDGKNYDEERTAGQKQFIEECRDSGEETCGNIELTDPLGDVSIAGCVNNDVGRPWAGDCRRFPIFDEEREARSLHCVDHTNINSSLCRNAKSNNPCVMNPFGNNCDVNVYETVRDNRDTYCRGAGRTDGDTLCTGIEDFICDGTEAMGDPFVPLCGDTNQVRQVAFCTLTSNADVRCEDDKAKVCPGNPFNSSFGPHQLDCADGDTYLSNRVTACGGVISDLPAGDAGLCNDEKLSGAICGTGSEVGSDPFAEICSDPTATAIITAFDKDMEQQEFCGATRKTGERAGECETIYTGLCTGDNLVDDTVGAGDFNCLIYDDTDVVKLRNIHCTTAETSFTDGCEDGTHGDAAGDVDAAQESLALTCRTTPDATGCATVVDIASGVTVAGCSGYTGDEHTDGDPYQAGCEDDVFNAERTVRDLACAVVETLGTPLCTNAKSNNPCVNDPFGKDAGNADCNPTDYASARTNRDAYCIGADIMTDDPLCLSRKDYICDGTEALGDPTASLCGIDNRAGLRVACMRKEDTSGECSNDEMAVCGSNPFNPRYGAFELNCTTSDYYSARIPTCRGAKSTWAAVGASVEYCSVKEVAGEICGTTDLIGTDAFADICEESTAMTAIDNFDQDTERQQFCGASERTDIRVTECAGIYTGLCTDDNLVKDSVGAGRFNCLDYDDPDVVDLRNTHCTTPATSFTDGCEDGTHGENAGDVNTARKNLAAICRDTPRAPGCDKPVNGVDGRTVLLCSDHATGDPYHDDCLVGELRTIFEDARALRATYCSVSTRVNELGCHNARDADICIHFPYGNDKDGMECSAVDYAGARASRDSYCKNALATDLLCPNRFKALCDGMEAPDELGTDNPFGLACDDDNSAAQRTWCGNNGDDPRCDSPHAGSCLARPFDTIIPHNLNAEDVNCLTHGGGETYKSQRQLLCAKGTQDVGNEDTPHNCDTSEIAEVVCGTSEGPNSNPFAAFCENAQNDGLADDAARLAVRQGTVAFCAISSNSAKPVCENAGSAIRALDITCTEDGATSVTEQCDYAKYFGTQEAFCTTGNNIFDDDCMDSKHGAVTLARQTECRQITPTAGVIDRGKECPAVVINLCEGSAFVRELNNDLEQGYLCGTNIDNVNYVTERETTCGNARPEDSDPNKDNCNAFLTTLCEGKEFTTAGTADYYNCATDPTFNTYREMECGASGNGDGTRTNNECKATITRICDEGDSLTTAGNGYDCLNSQIAEVITERRTFCATDSVNTPGCTDVLVELCSDSNSFSGAAKTGTDGMTFDCTMGETYRPQRRDYCAKGNNDDMVAGCPDVLATLCNGIDSVGTAATGVDSNEYNCLTSQVTEVITEQRVFCATSAGTSGCNTVLAGLCTGDKSLSGTVDRGDGTDYNCAGNSDQLVINERQAYCADGDNDDMVAGCPDVIDALCTGKLVETSVPTGTGTFYPCATSEVPAVKTARENHCRLAANHSGGLCNGTIAALCSINPFEERDSDGFGSLCVDSGGTTYAADRKSECRNNGTEGDGQTDGKCATLKDEICDGDDVGDSPYADVCGTGAANLAGQTAFCRLSTHPMPVAKCTGTIETVCHVGTGNPFDTLCDTTRHGDRATRCRQSILPTNPVALPIGADCADTIALACAGGDNGGVMIDAKPFDTICFADETYNVAREALCRPGGGDESNGGCGKTITTYCGEVGKVNTANVFDSLCTIDMTYDGDRETFCTTGETIFDARCNDTHGEVTVAQKAECLKTGMSTYTRGDVVCPDFVAEECKDPFTKQTADTTRDLCTGNNNNEVSYDSLRSTECGRATDELPSDVTLCRTDKLSGMICGNGIAVGQDGSVVGTNPFADICKSATGNIHYTTRVAAKEIHCDATPTATGCPDFLTTLCEGANSVKADVGAGEYNCAGDVNQLTERKDFCREDTNSDGLCTDTIVVLCEADPFEQKADDSYVCGDVELGTGKVNYQNRREVQCLDLLTDSKCTPTIERVCGPAAMPVIDATNVDNGLCDGSVYNIARGEACSRISDAVERGKKCGSETTAGTDWHAYCNTGDGSRNEPVCPMTFRDPVRRACIDTNPFAGTCDATYHGNRVQACIDKDKMATIGNNCDATVLLICAGGANGDDTIDANPFHELCNEGMTYDKARLTFCEGDPANLPTDVAVSACKDTDLSGAICGTGTGDGSDSTHGTNPYAEICNEPEALTENFNLTVARGTFCTEFSYNNNCTDNDAVKWKDTAVDEAGEPGLNVLSAGDADGITNTAIVEDNPVTNYILGQINELNLGFDQTNVPDTITNLQKDDLKLADLDITVDAGNSVAFAAFTNAEDTTSQQKFYAGLLSNTDLGELLTADTTISTVWKAKAAIIVGTGAVVTDDFTLEVIFDVGGNTITTRTGDLISFGTGITFAIMGKFNTDGVIFGETTYTDTNSGDSSTGTVTGLIGEYGAVGAFISKTGGTAGDFAGGFVADNPNAGTKDCLATGTPFNKTVCPDEGDLRVQLCATRLTLTASDLPLDFDVSTDCGGDSAIVAAICTNTGPHANIFDTLCNTGYEDQRTEFCKTIAEFANPDCDGGNRKVEICDGNDADDNPYAKICGDGIANLDGQRTFCRLSGTSTPVGGCIDTVATTCQLDVNPFDTFCGESYHTQRVTRCRNSMLQTNPVTLPGGVVCTDTIAVVCAGNMDSGGTIPADPFDAFCVGGYDELREAACRPGGSNPNGADCTDTIENFCGTPTDEKDIFDPLCTIAGNSYGNARRDHCLNLAFNEDPTNCGEEGTDDTVLGEYCKTGANELHCPNRHTALLALVDTTDWVGGARNSNNTDDLTILDSVGADDAFDTNYVKAGTDGLNLGVVNDDNATKITDGVLLLSEAGVTDAQGSGVAFARIDYADFTAGSKVKYYAGILSGTDLGGTVATSNSDTVVEWDLVLSIVLGDREVETVRGIKLAINFKDRLFQRVTQSLQKRPGATIGIANEGFEARKVFIEGGFTTEGIIYGTTKIGPNRSTTVSKGTLTGLIGEKGAVAAFVSDGTTGGAANQFAGGFVADNPDPAFDVDCSLATGTPFDTSKCLVSTRAALCRARRTNSVMDEQCQTAEIRGVICVAPGESDFANVFDSICNGDDYTALRISLRCTTEGNYADLADTLCDTTATNNFEAERRGAFCIAADAGGQANPFHPVCGEEYAVLRQTACAGQPVDVPSGGRLPDHARCTDPISKLCEAEPFNPTAGAGDTKFDCLGANDNNYVMARQVEIGLCVNGEQMDKERAICSDAEVTKITDACHVNTGDPFASACTDYAEQYMMQRETRLIACRVATREDAACTNAISTICTTGDTPFADICHEQLAARKSVVGACLDVVVANEEATASDIRTKEGVLLLQPIPASCSVMVVAGKTVLDCINDPFNSECDVDTIQTDYCPTRLREAQCQKSFYAATAKVCETSTTSFTAECLDPANGFVPPEIRTRLTPSQTARKTLINRCTDTGADGMPNTTNDEGCNTVIFKGAMPDDNITLADCIENPFLTECRGDVLASALANSADAVKIRDALVGMCEGFNSQNASVECKTIVAGGATIEDGGKTIEFCTKNPFDADCSVGDFTAAFNRFRGPKCTTAATSFDPGCTEEEYSITVADEVTIKYRDTARAELALSCADADDKGQNGCDTPVSGVATTITIDGCNADPFATGCESPAFINARLEACKNDASPNAACSVAGALERTNYVTGVENGFDSLYATNEEGTDLDETYNYVKDDPKTRSIDESAVYKDGEVATREVETCEGEEPNRTCTMMTEEIEDDIKTPIDESRVRVQDIPGNALDESKIRITYNDPNTFVDETKALKEGVQVGGLNLNAAGYADTDPGVFNDQSASGFALAYIPEVRGGDRRVTSESRYYAGLLAATDVGPEFYNATGTAAWTGKLSLVNKGVLSDVADFTLDINFDTRTIGASDTRTHTTYRIETYMDDLGAQQERSVADKIFPVKVDYAHTTLGQFYIDGKFTTKGVIYGTTKLVNDGGFRITEPNEENQLTKAEATSVRGVESSRGSLTGVIGQNGAVGAFISSGSGNTFGEYAGGFVAAREFDCSAKPLDIRCNESQYYGRREALCGGYQQNPACLPVLERVCGLSGNLFLGAAKSAFSGPGVSIDCLRAPLALDLRTAACRMSTDAPNDCGDTIIAVCGNNIFDALCTDVNHASIRYSSCSLALDGDVSTGDIKNISKCGTLITRECEDDPFNAICYVAGTTFDTYSPARVAKCADHNFAASNTHCGNKENSGIVNPLAPSVGPRVNVIGDYCTGLTDPATDKYELCNDKSADYLAWRNADNNGVTGYRSAKANDVGIIAGDATGLNLGDGATSVGNEMTLFLSDSTTNGVAIASATVGGQLQFYSGLLSGADVGAPVAGVSGATARWTGEIALLWQNADDEAVSLTNDNFVIVLTYGGSSTLLNTDIRTTLSGVDSATFTLSGSVTNREKLATGTITLNAPTGTVGAIFRGLIGEDGLLASFATHPTAGSGRRTGRGAYAGAFIAEDLGNICLGNGVGEPFSDTRCRGSENDPQRLAEATRCYANGASTSGRPINGDCFPINSCFDSVFSNLSYRFNGDGASGFTVFCENPEFDGVRAVYCANNFRDEPDDSKRDANCKKLEAREAVARTDPNGPGGHYSECIVKPLDVGCAGLLGAEAVRLAGFQRATRCMMGDNVETQGRLCSGFITAVQNCRRNPFGNQDYQTAAEIEAGTAAITRSCEFVLNDRIGAGFADKANELRLAHCNANPTDGDLCSGALTHCAVPAPDTGCGTLVANYCLGAEGRIISFRDNACTEQIAMVCNANPFDNARCKDASQTVYETARLEYCEGDGMTGGDTGLDGSVTLAKCSAAGLDLTICGNGSNKLGTNPFAEVCKTLASNRNFHSLPLLKSNYCSQMDSETFTLAQNPNCTQLVTETCGTDELNPIVDNALDPLCHQEIYNYAKVQFCNRVPEPAECGTQKIIANLCPPTGKRSLGCPASANSTPTSVWVDNALNKDGETMVIGERGSIATAPARAFVQADREGLDLTTFYKDGIVASGLKDGVAVQSDTLKFDAPTDPAVTPTGGISTAIVSTGNNSSQRYYAGLLLGTDVGGPIRNNSANGLWRGVYTISRYRILTSNRPPISSFSRTTDFTATVNFNGTDGTITTPGGPNALKINARFNLDGVIYGVTSIYSLQNDADNRNVGTITGLIGKTGAAAVFMSTGRTESGKTGHPDSGQYVGGFVLTPDTAYVEGVDCSATGTPLNLGICSVANYPDATARAVACNNLGGYDGNARAVCKMKDVQDLVCIDTGPYADPFNTIICLEGGNSITLPTLRSLQRSAANLCDADSTSAPVCLGSNIAPCLADPYSSINACGNDSAFADIRRNREVFCGMAGSETDSKCITAVATCTGFNKLNCGGFLRTYCLGGADRTATGTDKVTCQQHIEYACTIVNPWGSRCNDAGADVYLTDRIGFCSSQSIAQLTDLGVDLATDCRQHAEAICGYYIAPETMGAGRLTPQSGTRHDQPEVINTGTNPFAEICASPIANPGRDILHLPGDGDYTENRIGAPKQQTIIDEYNRLNCPTSANHESAHKARNVICEEINVVGAAGYEAWKAAVNPISAGNAFNDTEIKANFIAGYHGGLYLGVGNGNVANAGTFRIVGTQSGFAYASTGDQLFTGLLSGTTDLGAVLVQGAEPTLTWRSTLSFLTSQSGSIAAITKEGFVLTVTFGSSSRGTIAGRENVGTGMVFQVAGIFTGTDNLLSGTVAFGATESGSPDSDDFAVGGLQTTGILTGIIGAEGVVGVFKSNAGGHFGDFVGGFIAAPVTHVTTTTWANSFGVVGQNIPTPVGGQTEGEYLVRLLPTGFEIVSPSSIPIAGNAGSFIKLNELNQIQGRETSVVNGKTVTNTIQSLSFANNPALKTPDNGDSGITFGNIAVPGINSRFVRLVGLFPTTNMGLPLKSPPLTTIWRGKMSVIASGKFQGERDVRFMINYNTESGGGTITTTERVNIFTELGSEYFSLAINAEFDKRGAVYGTTDLTRNRIASDLSLISGDADTDGRVSGLIGQKGLIGAFVSSYYGGQNPRKEYVGGFYALNPDAPRIPVENIVLVSGPTNRNLWGDSFNAGAVNDYDTMDRHDIPDDDVNNPNAVDAFGTGAPAGQARFARSGADSYIGTAADAFRSLNFSFDKDSGVGFGRVENGYYSGLLRGANVGISLSDNQLITTAATWTGKIALFGVGSGTGGAKQPSSADQDLSLEVTFDGTEGTINTITGKLPTFGQWFAGNGLDYTLTITGKFNVAGVISGTTSFYGADPSRGDKIAVNALAVEGELTGLIGTRGAIGSFISTKVFREEITFAGTYAGGFVVQHPDYEIVPEIEPIVVGTTDVKFSTWVSAVSPQAANFAASETARETPNNTYFIQGTDATGNDFGITGWATVLGTTKQANNLFLTDAKEVSAGGVVFTYINGYGTGNNHYAAGLLNTANVGGALLSTSPPATAVWEGKISAVAKGKLLDERDFLLKVSFDGAVGRIWSTDSTGTMGDMASGHPQLVGPGVKPGRFPGNAINIGLTGTFNADGVMTGTVRANDSESDSNGVFNGIIGAKGALGVFKSNVNEPYSYAGGFTAQNPDFGTVGATDDYRLWRVSFNSRGVNRRVSDPTNPGAKLASALQPRGVNVNQFPTGTTHFVEGTADGLNITGSSIVTDKSKTTFNPTLLTLTGVEGGIALWQGDINIAGAATPNIQGYGGMLISTDVGADPLSAGTTTYSGKIQAYVGGDLSEVTDFTLKINYGDNKVDAVATLLNTRFKFDGRFNFLGVISGDVLTGAAGAESLQGSFNGLLGTDAAVGVFKNTVGNTDGTFIGGFVVSDKFVNYPEWLDGFAEGGANATHTLLDSVGDDEETTGTHFVRATATRIRGVTPESLNSLRLTGLGLDGGVVFAQEASGAGYTGLLSTVNVGLPLKNADFNMVWTGKIRSYVGAVLSAETDFNLTVTYTGGVNVINGTVMLENMQFTFDGNFNATGVMSGNVSAGASAGVFNGLIGQGGAVGAFKNNTGDSFVGGFVVKPDTVDFDDWANRSNNFGQLSEGSAKTARCCTTDTFFIEASTTDSVAGIAGITVSDNLTLGGNLASGGVVFGRRVDGNSQDKTYYTGLLKGTDVGRHIDNKDLNMVWTGQIQAYVSDGNTLTGKSTFYLDVDFGASDTITNAVGRVQSTTAVTGGTKGAVTFGGIGTIHINGHFNRSGVMWGDATLLPTANAVSSPGTFNGIIGTTAAVGVFKDDNSVNQADSFAGGFVVKPQ